MPGARPPPRPQGLPGAGLGPGERSISSDFGRFHSEFPLFKWTHPRTDLAWSYYQAGTAGEGDPIIFLHGTSGTAGAFFYQVQALARKGYRVISAQYPAYNTLDEWCKGFDIFLDAMKCRKSHIFGAGLGGYLAQHFAVRYPLRVRSLLLCNTFVTTAFFAEEAGTLASVIFMMPTPLLQKVVLDAFPQTGMELSAKQAVDFVALQVNDLSGSDIASRLKLNCTMSNVGNIQLQLRCITIVESNGETMVPDKLRRELRAFYPDARVAQLKASGDFPYLSGPDEATLFVEVHMRGMGVFPSSHSPSDFAHAPTLATARDLDAPASRSAGKDGAGTSAHNLLMAAAAPPQRPRPIWKNPFEDDPLL